MLFWTTKDRVHVTVGSVPVGLRLSSETDRRPGAHEQGSVHPSTGLSGSPVTHQDSREVRGTGRHRYGGGGFPDQSSVTRGGWHAFQKRISIFTPGHHFVNRADSDLGRRRCSRLVGGEDTDRHSLCRWVHQSLLIYSIII